MSKNTIPLHVYDVGLEVLSPVAIGAGKEATLSPYTDFVSERNCVRILNQEKFLALLAERPKALDDYVNMLRAGMDNNRSTFDLREFITDDLKTDLDDVTCEKLECRANMGKKELHRCINSNGLPYIPGSSLKGAFRTAVMFDWLINDERSDSIRTKIVNAVKFKPGIKVKQAQRILKNVKLSQACFGDIKYDQLKYLHLSDMRLQESRSSHVLEKSCYSLKKGVGDIPVVTEALRRGTRLYGDLRIPGRHPDRVDLEKEKIPHLDYFEFLHENDEESLLHMLNEFSYCNVEREIEILEGKRGFQAPLRFYRQLISQIDKPGKNEAFIRIGGGKTYFDNSVGLMFDESKLEHVDQLRQLLGVVFGKKDKLRKLNSSVDFPTSRSFSQLNGKPDQPFGWIKLTLHSRD